MKQIAAFNEAQVYRLQHGQEGSAGEERRGLLALWTWGSGYESHPWKQGVQRFPQGRLVIACSRLLSAAFLQQKLGKGCCDLETLGLTLG